VPRYTITNFSRGEFGPELYGRVDVLQYNAGAKELTNFLIQRYGGAAFRPGWRFVGEVDDAAKSHRYMPFQFSNEQAYVTVLGDEQLRLLAMGGFVTEDDLKITGMDFNATVTVAVAFHDYVIGDRVYIDGTDVPGLNGRFATVTAVPDASHVTLNVDSTAFGALTTSTGIVRVGPPTPPPAPEPPPPAPPPDPDPPTTTSPTVPPGTGGGTGTYYGGGQGGFHDFGAIP
jgi:hypothetical protein